MSAKKGPPARQNGRFVKGQSGNPGGRAKEYRDVVSLARQATQAAVYTLMEIMRDPEKKESARVRAAEILLDRAWGKAPQVVDHKWQEWPDAKKLQAAKYVLSKLEAEGAVH